MSAKSRGGRARAPGRKGAKLERTAPLLVVGIGASAGGLEAFTRLLQALPADSGMAFVLVQHLSPTRASVLAEILARATTMPVTEVAAEPALEPNHVYVIPPDKDMEIVRGHLRLLPRQSQGVQLPIDVFFRSLARHQGHRAIGVVLSGTATDGTIGLEEIKAAGGFTFAQDESALQQGMPQSAAASGCVDRVLSPENIAAEIARIAELPYVASPMHAQPEENDAQDAALSKERLAPVLRILQEATGIDFQQYKSSTLSRRIGRRMALQKRGGVESYARLLQKDATEADALSKDILINVTSFFRDPEVFETLRTNLLPKMLLQRPIDEPFRAWVVGCSTGEEVYSLAMILSEATDAVKRPIQVQILATDLNDNVIGQARAGVYPKARMRGVSPARLRRFFTEQGGDFRVSKGLREMCLFSRHNVMADPPFSRMDLVACRNLLIYVEPAVQQSIMPLLHHALAPAGLLVLGASETVGSLSHLFSATRGKLKIFRKVPGSGRVPTLPRTRASGAITGFKQPQIPSRRPSAAAGAARLSTDAGDDSGTVQLLASFAPPAVTVSGNLEILQFHGDTEPYLAPARGSASHALLKMARAGLQVPLQALLHRVDKKQAAVREEGLRFRSFDGYRRVDLEALPLLGDPARVGCFLVMFRDAATPARPPARGRKGARVSRTKGDGARESAAEKLARLELELTGTRGYLQALTEQYETANEELQSLNEEAQATNEEFQSINEELETSREEIQSSNEELTTINDELTHRNQELAQLTSDLTNLIQSVHVAIVIVARDLRIRRFSPMAEKLLSILPADVGRPLTDIRLNLLPTELGPLLTAVIQTRTAQEREVEAVDGNWYSLRVNPYIVDGSKVEGAVLSLIDITAIKRARDYAESIVATVREPLLVLDEQLRVRSASRSFYEAFGVTRRAVEGVHLYELGNGEWSNPELRHLLEEILPLGLTVDNFTLESEFPNLGRRIMLVNARRLADPTRGLQSILLSIEDVTQRRQQADELSQRNADLAAGDAAKNHFLAVLSHELRSPLNIISLWSQILQRPDRSEDTLRRGLEIIDSSSKTQARLVEDLLDVHRISSGKLQLELVEVNLADVVVSVLDAMEPAATQKGVILAREIDPTPAFLSCDANRLQQVFGNVLGNAIKFTPEGGRVEVVLRTHAMRCQVTISDNGIGMDPAAIPGMFAGFRQEDPLTSRSHGGLGLGLAIAKQLVELHGGEISAESSGKGRGVTVKIAFPVLKGKRAAHRPPGIEAATAQNRSLPLAGIHVLVVDDEADAREAVCWVLETAGARTTGARSTDDALLSIQREPPDLILSDIGMPERDGYDLMRTVRALPSDQGGRIPAIAVTAYAATEDRSRALEAGFERHLAKPLEPARLLATIAALLSPRREVPA